jgi:hypothetical protein
MCADGIPSCINMKHFDVFNLGLSSEMFPSFCIQNTIPLLRTFYEVKNNALCGHHICPSVIQYQWLNHLCNIYINFPRSFILSFNIGLISLRTATENKVNPDQFPYLPSYSYTSGKYSRANWPVYCDLTNAITTFPHSLLLCKIGNFVLSNSYTTATNFMS